MKTHLKSCLTSCFIIRIILKKNYFLQKKQRIGPSLLHQWWTMSHQINIKKKADKKENSRNSTHFFLLKHFSFRQLYQQLLHETFKYYPSDISQHSYRDSICFSHTFYIQAHLKFGIRKGHPGGYHIIQIDKFRMAYLEY